MNCVGFCLSKHFLWVTPLLAGLSHTMQCCFWESGQLDRQCSQRISPTVSQNIHFDGNILLIKKKLLISSGSLINTDIFKKETEYRTNFVVKSLQEKIDTIKNKNIYLDMKKNS